jgi:hypothetical protein
LAFESASPSGPVPTGNDAVSLPKSMSYTATLLDPKFDIHPGVIGGDHGLRDACRSGGCRRPRWWWSRSSRCCLNIKLLTIISPPNRAWAQGTGSYLRQQRKDDGALQIDGRDRPDPVQATGRLVESCMIAVSRVACRRAGLRGVSNLRRSSGPKSSPGC